jgi:cell division protein FtsL
MAIINNESITKNARKNVVTTPGNVLMENKTIIIVILLLLVLSGLLIYLIYDLYTTDKLISSATLTTTTTNTLVSDLSRTVDILEKDVKINNHKKSGERGTAGNNGASGGKQGRLYNINSQKYMSRGAEEGSATAILEDIEHTTKQYWTFTDKNTLVNKHGNNGSIDATETCLTKHGNSLKVEDCESDKSAQQWKWGSDGTLRPFTENSNKCIASKGTGLELQECSGITQDVSENRLWMFT